MVAIPPEVRAIVLVTVLPPAGPDAVLVMIVVRLALLTGRPEEAAMPLAVLLPPAVVVTDAVELRAAQIFGGMVAKTM